MDISLYFSIASLVISIVGVTVTGYLSWRQEKIGKATFKDSWLRSLRAWAEEAVDVLSESSYACHHGYCDKDANEAERRRSDCIHRLSSLVDRGRFFLPNELHEDYGLEKPLAYRGYRHASLDYLVAAIRVLEGRNASVLAAMDKSEAKILVDLKREYVSQVQHMLDPRQQNKEIADLIGPILSGKNRPITVKGLDALLP